MLVSGGQQSDSVTHTHVSCLVSKSCPTFATPWTAACQDPLSIGFPKQEYWSGLPFPFPGAPPDPGINSASPALQVDSLPGRHPGSPFVYLTHFQILSPFRWLHNIEQSSSCCISRSLLYVIHFKYSSMYWVGQKVHSVTSYR